jgi:hypothetical protein
VLGCVDEDFLGDGIIGKGSIVIDLCDPEAYDRCPIVGTSGRTL